MLRHNMKAKLFSLFLFSLFFVFIAYLLYPSDLSLINKELRLASSKEDVKFIWEKNKEEYYLNEDFYKEIVNKLNNFKLNDKEIEEVFTWLPDRRQTSINLIVVPDLSARIIQENNNPEQVTRDKFLINKIWENFSNLTSNNINSKSSFLLTVTDDEQVRGDFYKIASNMTLDLHNKKESERVRDILQRVNQDFSKNLDLMYDLGKQKTSGADYFQFFDRKLSSYFKKPTLTDKYDNKLIIITDGYFELENGKVYTENLPGIGAKVSQGMSLDTAMKMYGNPIPKTSYNELNKWDILVLEINERNSGAGSDFSILKKYWTDWFTLMGNEEFANSNNFVQRDSTTQIAENRIIEFLK